MGSQITLYDSLQREFCPPLDTSLLTALLADLEIDSNGKPRKPSAEEVGTLRETLTQLATQAECDEHQLDSQLVERLDICKSAPSVNTEDTTTGSPVDFFDEQGDTTSSDSGTSHYTFSSPLGFLQAAFPHVRTATLRCALSDAGEENDMESIIEGILTKEFIQELEERGLDGLEADERLISAPKLLEKPWKTIESKKKPRDPAKLGKRKGRTIATVDIRQQQHARPVIRVDTGNIARAAPDPWTQLLSLSEHLATLLPPHPTSFFVSYFHSPKYATPSIALRAALEAMSAPSPKSAPNTIVLFNIFDLVCSSSTYDTLDSEQRSRLLLDAQLCLGATHGRGEDALDVVWLLHDLDRDSRTSLEMGVYHSPAPLASPTFSAAVTASPTRINRSYTLTTTKPPNGSPIPQSPLVPKEKQKPPLNSDLQWQAIPPRKPPPGPHPHAAFIPAYATAAGSSTKVRGSGNGIGKGGKGDVGELGRKRRTTESLKKRDELLREASRAWMRGNKRTRGGEVALYYAQRAREFQELARQESLDHARMSVDSKRLASSDRDTIDLHGTTVAEAITIVRDILRSEGSSQAKPLKIITGRGTHSTNKIGVLKPAVKSALTADGWNVGSWDGGLVVRGKTS